MLPFQCPWRKGAARRWWHPEHPHGNAESELTEVTSLWGHWTQAVIATRENENTVQSL